MLKNAMENPSNAPSPVLGVVLGSISLLTIVMNILVLCAVRTERKLQTVGNLYIVSLSVADLIVGAAVMPLNIVYLLSPEWPLGRAACLFWLSMDYVACTASIFNLFVLCVDRYRSVQQPLRYLRYRTKMRASLLILGVWLLSFTWVIPILGWHAFANRGHRRVRENQCETEFSSVPWFKVLTAIFNFYLPSLLMLCFYLKIFRAVRRHCQHRQLANGSPWTSLEKATVGHSRTKEEKSIGLQKQSLGENSPGTDKLSSPEPQKAESEPHFSNPGRSEKALSNGKLLKWGCFSLSTTKPEVGSEKARKKGGTKKNRNKEQAGGEDSDSSVVSDAHTFTEAAPGAEQPSSSPERPCSPEGEAERRDSRGLESGDPKGLESRDSRGLECKDSRGLESGDSKGLESRDSRGLECKDSRGLQSGDSQGLQSGDSQGLQSTDSQGLAFLRKTWHTLQGPSGRSSHRQHGNRERKAARQLGVIMAAFMLCWIPYFVFFLVVTFHEHKRLREVHMVTTWLGYVNSTLNPFLYPLCNQNFKKTFKKILRIH